MTANLIDMSDVVFSYGKEQVIKQVSLEIESGEFIGIIGPNGSGKSTLLRLIGALIQNQQGQIQFKQEDIREISRKTLARSVAWIPQDVTMIFPFKVEEIVMMGRHPYQSPFNFEDENDWDITRRAMEETDTLSLSHRRFNEISGGEKQRVMMAGALAQNPELLLLDEPTSSLDIKYQLEILNILRRLNQQNGKTIVVAIHDLYLASKYCDRLILLNEGRIIHDGPPVKVLRKDILEKVYGVQIKIFHDQEDGGIMVSPANT
jgi:iron complex transport system ATP-binding protein